MMDDEGRSAASDMRPGVDTDRMVRCTLRPEQVNGAEVTLRLDPSAFADADTIWAMRQAVRVDVIVHTDDRQFAVLVDHPSVRLACDETSNPVKQWYLDETAGEECGVADAVACGVLGDGSDEMSGDAVAESSGDDSLLCRRAVVSLESVSTNAESMFRQAVVSMDAFAGTQVEGISPLYHVGALQGSDGMSAVVQLRTGLSPTALIAALQEVERLHDGAVDLDVVDMQGVHENTLQCRIPWPSAKRRAAVLAPWLDMDANAECDGDPVAFLLANADDAARVGVLSDQWIVGAM